MNTLMTFSAKSHPIGAIMGVIFSISIYVMAFHLSEGMAFFTFFSEKLYRPSLPISFAVGSTMSLEQIVTCFGAKSFSTFMFPWSTFKRFRTFLTRYETPFFYSKTFSKIMVGWSDFFLKRLSIRTIMAKTRTIFCCFIKARKHFIGLIAQLTRFSNFRHTRILSHE